MRIRKKLIVLHTVFSLGLAGMLTVALWPTVARVVREAERSESRLLLRLVVEDMRASGLANPRPPVSVTGDNEASLSVRSGEEALDLHLAERVAEEARASPFEPILLSTGGAVAWVPTSGDGRGVFVEARATIPQARRAVLRLYAAFLLALLAVYALVALALEAFVLPSAVYAPIRTMLEADLALREGRPEGELIPDANIPGDELGQIMRSRNDTIATIRTHERDLAEALRRFEAVAADLRRKNHLLETARRNLADADRLASLGIMSAGIAHELNTPLAVIKGLAERMGERSGSAPDPVELALLSRVVGRLERLGESLLDFARARPASFSSARVGAMVGEAVTLVRIDREAREVEFRDRTPSDLSVECDPDRMVQVLVNLIRNAVDSVQSVATAAPVVEIGAGVVTRDESEWVSITIADNGPGIRPDVLPRLFEPFVSTRLDARGTGLGLAVAEGIIREHSGVIVARNRPDARGALFEIVLPLARSASAGEPLATGVGA